MSQGSLTTTGKLLHTEVAALYTSHLLPLASKDHEVTDPSNEHKIENNNIKILNLLSLHILRQYGNY